MPKKQVPVAPGPLNRKQLSHRAREQRMHRYVIIGAVAVAALVVLVLGIGLYEQYVARPRTPVATVYDTPIRLSEYQQMYKYRRDYYTGLISQAPSQISMLQAADANSNAFYIQYLQSEVQQYQSTMSSLPQLVLNQMIDTQLVRHEAAQRGITVSAEEIDTRMEEAFGYYRPTPTPDAAEAATLTAMPPTETPTMPPTATATVTPTADVAATATAAAEPTATAGPTPTLEPTWTPAPTATPITYEGYQSRVTEWVQGESSGSGFTEADLRQLFESDLIREKVEAALIAEVPTSGEQIQARYMTFDTQDDAQAALARLQAGEDFATLAAEVSTDTTTKDSGGELGWLVRGQMNDDAFDTAAFALQPGETSEVVALSSGAAIIQVEDRRRT
jgi:parvulin-like peptidyl-prolyl isomerase